VSFGIQIWNFTPPQHGRWLYEVCVQLFFLFYQATSEHDDQGATRTYELDTEKGKDAQAIFERSQQINKVCMLQKFD
jgi:hypothetical protein